MQERRHVAQIFGAFIAIAFLLVGIANASGNRMLNANLEETIEKVRTEKSLTARTQAAHHVAELTLGINPKSVDDKTVADMVSLLDSAEDSVRAWVAAALGHLGPRTKVAVPKLLALLAEADCLQGDLTSAAAIRPALTRIGVKPPPFNAQDCK